MARFVLPRSPSEPFLLGLQMTSGPSVGLHQKETSEKQSRFCFWSSEGKQRPAFVFFGRLQDLLTDHSKMFFFFFEGSKVLWTSGIPFWGVWTHDPFHAGLLVESCCWRTFVLQIKEVPWRRVASHPTKLETKSSTKAIHRKTSSNSKIAGWLNLKTNPNTFKSTQTKPNQNKYH